MFDIFSKSLNKPFLALSLTIFSANSLVKKGSICNSYTEALLTEIFRITGVP
jgi:hypothetical protein